MAHDHNGQTATLLADGMVLVVGGTDGTAELYQPASSPTPAPSPTGTASPTPVLKTIQDLLASPHPTTTTAAVVAAIHAAFAADPSVTLEGSHPIFEAMFTGHPATPGFKPPVPMPHSSPVTYVCSYDSGPCGMGFLYGCAQNGMPWDGGHAPVNRIAQCNSEIGLLFQAYRATGHEAFYDATLTLYNYSVHAIPTQAAWLKANLLRDFA